MTYKGMRFHHRRQIDGSPLAGTARPVEMTVTAVRMGKVYYRRSDSTSTKGAWVMTLETFPTIVLKVIE